MKPYDKSPREQYFHFDSLMPGPLVAAQGSAELKKKKKPALPAVLGNIFVGWRTFVAFTHFLAAKVEKYR